MKDRQFCYCFMGPPGAGKGTQAELVCGKIQFRHISTGNILREAIQKKTALGLKAESYMNQGRLVPDPLIVDLVEEVLSGSSCRGFVLDGFPRTIPQAGALDHLLKKRQVKLMGVFLFLLDHGEIIKRITGRRLALRSGQVYHIDFRPPKKEGVCDLTGEKLIQREDDKITAVKIRLASYLEQQKGVTQYYRDKNLIKEISAEGSPQEVNQRLLKYLK